MAVRAAVLRHIRVPLQAAPKLQPWRAMSSHGDDHITKEEVIQRVLAVVKDYPKVDPSKVFLFFFLPHFHFFHPLLHRYWKIIKMGNGYSESWSADFTKMGCPWCLENEEGIFFIDLCKRVFPKFGNLAQLQSGWCLGS